MTKRSENRPKAKKAAASQKRITGRIPRDYIWKVLSKIDKDLKDNLMIDSPTLQAGLSALRAAVRARDVKKYITSCKESLSLTSLSDVSIDGDSALPFIRSLRLLTAGVKFNFFDSPYDQLDKAYKSFLKYERLCSRTNKDPIFQAFQSDIDDGSLCTFDCLFTVPRLRDMKDFIHRVLGDHPEVPMLQERLKHGPGATTDKRGDLSILIEKFIPPIGCTREAAPYVIQAIFSDAVWLRALMHDPESGLLSMMLRAQRAEDVGYCDIDIFQHFRELIVEVEDSRIGFVPKNTETLRTVEPQPTGNVAFQQAIDHFIRSSLLRAGIDLSTQEKNRQLAHKAFEQGLATIDLQGASDCVALTLSHLFPKGWRRLLTTFRCRSGVIEKKSQRIVFEKLSAMGNGFSFSVETLIFTAAVYAICCEKGISFKNLLPRIAVYGDDIIVPRSLVDDVLALLLRIGFQANTSKTFTSGNVFESCGHDFWKGNRIDRPTFSDHPTKTWELVRDHNLLAEWERRYGLKLDETKAFIRNLIPPNQLVVGPPSEDMVGWLHSHEPVDFTTKRNDGFQYDLCKIQRTIVTRPRIKNPNRVRRLMLYEPILMYSSIKGATHVFVNASQTRPWKMWRIKSLGSCDPWLNDSELWKKRNQLPAPVTFGPFEGPDRDRTEEIREELKTASDGHYLLKERSVVRSTVAWLFPHELGN